MEMISILDTRGSGDVSFLKKHAAAYGYVVDNCEKLCVHGEEISSTMIRGYIAEGRMETVTELLGRPYEINGKVIPGKANGRKVDMRTANLAPDDLNCCRRKVYMLGCSD